MLAGDVKDVLLLDVTPLTLGIETKGGVMTKLIERNTTIPTRKSEIFSTAEDNQPSVEVHVLQGEREMAAYNKSLGKFQLTASCRDARHPADRGHVRHRRGRHPGRRQGPRHRQGAEDPDQGRPGLAEEEVERMVKDAEAHAEEDRRQREVVETRNEAENAAYQAERQVNEMGDLLDSSSKEEIEAAIKDVRDNLESDDVELLRQKTQALQEPSTRCPSRCTRPRSSRPPRRQRRVGRGRAPRTLRDEEEVVDAEVVDGEDKSQCSRPRAARSPEEEPTSRDEGASPPARRTRRTSRDGGQGGGRGRRAVEEQPEDYLALAQRIQADFENYRKRAAREAAAAGERAKSGLVRAAIVDNLERALASAEDGEQHLAEGVRPASTQSSLPC